LEINQNNAIAYKLSGIYSDIIGIPKILDWLFNGKILHKEKIRDTSSNQKQLELLA